MKKYFWILMFASFSALCEEAATALPDKTEKNPKEFKAKLPFDDSYVIYPSKEEGGTVYFLHCKNNQLLCGYNWDQLCDGGKAVAASPSGVPDPELGKAPSTIYLPKVGLLRIFMCVDDN